MYHGNEEDHNGVLYFLQSLDLDKYWDVFRARGFDRESDILELSQNDMDSMRIKADDGKIILEAASSFQVSSHFTLLCYLEKYGLSHYYDNLRRCDVTELIQLERLEVDDTVFTILEMDMPCHRKRLIRACSQLRKRQKVQHFDVPLTEGYWGKPSHLEQAKNDFLCLKADLISTVPARKTASLEFMVDSGSEVVTVLEEVIKELNLELIGTIQSHGVHSSKPKDIYKGTIRIGGVDVDTEVMSETYNSIGNQVLRNFRHVIDSKKHFWYKGDQRFLPPRDLIPGNWRPTSTTTITSQSVQNAPVGEMASTSSVVSQGGDSPGGGEEGGVERQ